MKNLINEQPIYNSLYGMLKEVSVASVIRMLKRKTVTTTEIRIKYALLAMLTYIVPTTHVAKISVEHTERIRNLDEFFSFPIKERDEILLSQSTIAIAGYVQALQMVLTKAIPALTDVVRHDSATEGGGVEDDDFLLTPPKNSIKPAYARTLYTAKNVRVTSIILPENLEVDEAVLCFSNKEDDESVDKIVTLIKEGTRFTKEMFKGLATKADVASMRDEADAIGKKKRKRKSCDPDAEYTTPRGHVEIRDNIRKVEGKVDHIHDSIRQMQEVLKKHISDNYAQMLALQNSYKVILNSIGTSQSVPNYPPREGNPANNLRGDSSNSQIHANPTIHSRSADVSDIINSIVDNIKKTHVDNSKKGLTTHDSDQADVDHEDSENNQPSLIRNANAKRYTGDNLNDNQDVPSKIARPILSCPREKAIASRLSRSYWTVHISLTLHRFRETQLGALNQDATIDYPEKFIKLLEIMETTKSISVGGTSVTAKDLLDIDQRSRPVSAKNYTRFMKSPQKEDFVFTPNRIEILDQAGPKAAEAERIYFPFNLDQKHWIGLCVDCTDLKLIVLDCNTALRSYSRMGKELHPTSQMSPHLLKQAGRKLSTKDLKPLTVERVQTVPQNPKHTDAGVTAALLIEAHTVADTEGCKCLTVDVLGQEAQRLIVMLYEANAGPISI
ncbi:hypothetical protein N665_0195s0016 [Sinapis alba]|nr:hypothetical protein N665_0195s0016 [Sinapis alba]